MRQRDACDTVNVTAPSSVTSRRTIAISIATVVLWAIITPWVWRDLRRRPNDLVRGSKWIWAMASTNLSGSLAYLVVGRRSRPGGRGEPQAPTSRS